MYQIKLSMHSFRAETATSSFTTSEAVRNREGRSGQEITFTDGEGMKETGRSRVQARRYNRSSLTL